MPDEAIQGQCKWLVQGLFKWYKLSQSDYNIDPNSIWKAWLEGIYPKELVNNIRVIYCALVTHSTFNGNDSTFGTIWIHSWMRFSWRGRFWMNYGSSPKCLSLTCCTCDLLFRFELLTLVTVAVGLFSVILQLWLLLLHNEDRDEKQEGESRYGANDNWKKEVHLCAKSLLSLQKVATLLWASTNWELKLSLN